MEIFWEKIPEDQTLKALLENFSFIMKTLTKFGPKSAFNPSFTNLSSKKLSKICKRSGDSMQWFKDYIDNAKPYIKKNNFKEKNVKNDDKI